MKPIIHKTTNEPCFNDYNFSMAYVENRIQNNQFQINRYLNNLQGFIVGNKITNKINRSQEYTINYFNKEIKIFLKEKLEWIKVWKEQNKTLSKKCKCKNKKEVI